MIHLNFALFSRVRIPQSTFSFSQLYLSSAALLSTTHCGWNKQSSSKNHLALLPNNSAKIIFNYIRIILKSKFLLFQSMQSMTYWHFESYFTYLWKNKCLIICGQNWKKSCHSGKGKISVVLNESQLSLWDLRLFQQIICSAHLLKV